MTDDGPSVGEDIRKEIKQRGRITFARYMELALYAPGKGYYSGSASGFSGTDYITSPLAHPVFGALLGRQLYQIWSIMGTPDQFLIVEPGAGNGTLACDVLNYIERAIPLFYENITYIAIDCTPSPFELSNHHENLEYLRSYGLPSFGGEGCIISNELIDAYPVHRFKVDHGKLIESYVHMNSKEDFVEIFDEPSTDLLSQRLQELGIPFRDDLKGEINLHIDDWAKNVSSCLDSGVAITIDYGDLAANLYQRPNGTLQTYYLQTDGGSPFSLPGKRDITAHVDFSSMIRCGAYDGLKYEGLIGQGAFLRNLGWKQFFETVAGMNIGRRELMANQIGMRHLVDQVHLGGLKVLVQSKNLEIGDQLLGFEEGNGSTDRGEVKPVGVPIMDDHHVSYLGTGYPVGQDDDWSYQRFL
jgi:SAM-dependent MidA family methyltransferase